MDPDSEPRTYPTEESAQRRVELLNRAGIWPGIMRHGDRWRLTTDPDIERIPRTPA